MARNDDKNIFPKGAKNAVRTKNTLPLSVAYKKGEKMESKAMKAKEMKKGMKRMGKGKK